MLKLSTILLCLTVSLASFASSLIKYVPSSAQAIVHIKPLELLNSPFAVQLREQDPQLKENWQKLQSDLNKLGLQIKDLPTEALIFFKTDKSLLGFIGKGHLSEQKMVKLIESRKQTDNQPAYKISDIEGHRVYTYQSNAGSFKDAALTYLTPDTFIVTPGKYMKATLQGMNKGLAPDLTTALKTVKKDSLVWLAVENNFAAQDPKAVVNSFIKPVKTISASLNLQGKAQRDLAFNSDIICTDNQSAANLAMQLNGITMLMIPQGFSKNPQLANKLAHSIKIAPEKNSIKVGVVLQETTLNELINYKRKAQTGENTASKPEPRPRQRK
ncbi:MAG: hypothetical protein GY718_19010 [Lentisphaerae bacterium]|nr:hypothetical protein [Lentisphaerota bacterium]